MSTRKLDLFSVRLSDWCRHRGLRCSRWSGASRQTANLLAISTLPVKTVIYVKDSSYVPGFWGLTRSQLSALEGADVEWNIVLLLGSGEVGYLVPSSVVTKATMASLWSFSQTDWKVHEGPELFGEKPFSTFDQLFALLVG